MNGLSSFENYMSKLGASVYAFDCTDWKRPEYLFEFYDWCIGKESSFQNNAYSKRKVKHTFFGLQEIQLKLPRLYQSRVLDSSMTVSIVLLLTVNSWKRVSLSSYCSNYILKALIHCVFPLN